MTGVQTCALPICHAWVDKAEYDASCRKLAEMFVKNFKKFEDDPGAKALVPAGPQLA